MLSSPLRSKYIAAQKQIEELKKERQLLLEELNRLKSGILRIAAKIRSVKTLYV